MCWQRLQCDLEIVALQLAPLLRIYLLLLFSNGMCILAYCLLLVQAGQHQLDSCQMLTTISHSFSCNFDPVSSSF